jgi:hypothetical protein
MILGKPMGPDVRMAYAVPYCRNETCQSTCQTESRLHLHNHECLHAQRQDLVDALW